MIVSTEHLIEAVRISWSIAHESDNNNDWRRRWKRIGEKLEGMWSIVLEIEPEVEDSAEIREEINLLSDIARQHVIDGFNGGRA